MRGKQSVGCFGALFIKFRTIQQQSIFLLYFHFSTFLLCFASKHFFFFASQQFSLFLLLKIFLFFLLHNIYPFFSFLRIYTFFFVCQHFSFFQHFSFSGPWLTWRRPSSNEPDFKQFRKKDEKKIKKERNIMRKNPYSVQRNIIQVVFNQAKFLL